MLCTDARCISYLTETPSPAVAKVMTSPWVGRDPPQQRLTMPTGSPRQKSIWTCLRLMSVFVIPFCDPFLIP